MKPHDEDSNEELKALEAEIDELSNSASVVGRRKKTAEEEKKSLERKRKKADKGAEQMSLRTILKKMLEDNDNERANNICNALVNNAEMGDTKSFETIYKVLTEEVGRDEDNNSLTPVTVNLCFADNKDGIRDKE